MSTIPFLDTSVLIRHFTNDHPDHSPRASAYLRSIELGEVEVAMTETVVFETVFTLERHYRLERTVVRDSVKPLIDLPNVRIGRKAWLAEAFDLYVGTRALSFADCLHAVVVMRQSYAGIVSFDRGFDRVPGLTRIEPDGT